MSESQKSAIIVGAGVGGTALAARLSRAGIAVTVLEKLPYTGGRCSLLYSSRGTHRFDQGPSLLHFPKFFHETFTDLGTSMSAEGIQLLRCNPNYKVHFPDGGGFTLSTDLVSMRKEVEALEKDEGAFGRYLEFLRESGQHAEVTTRFILRRNFESIWSMFRLGLLKSTLKLHVFESVWTRANKWFKSEKLRRAMTFGTMYLGMSPFEAMGTYSLLQYTELTEGIWYPVGGFHKVVEALVNIGQRNGAKYNLSTSVSRVLLSEDGKEATGVVLADGRTLTADLIILNCDLVTAYNTLLPQTPYAHSLARRDHSCSSISFYWALSRKLGSLDVHNVFLADDFSESFDAIFKQQSMPTDPSFYVNIPSRVDPSAAPEGQDVVVVLVPCGHLTPSSTPEEVSETVARAKKLVIATIEARTGERNIGEAIVEEQINTPYTWRDIFALHNGAILGMTHGFFNMLSFRPRTRCEGIKGVYFVGASAHPGTGVPICLAGAKIVERQIMKDLGAAKRGKSSGVIGLTSLLVIALCWMWVLLGWS